MAAIPSEDYYELLGLSQDCTKSQIKLTYKKLSLKVYPDRCRPDSKKVEAANIVFPKLHDAYEKLIDDAGRQQYDKSYDDIRKAREHLPKQDAASLLETMLGDSSPDTTPTDIHENGHDVKEYIRKARENEKRQRQQAEEAEARARQEREGQEREAQKRREQEKQAKEKEAKLQEKWIELSQQFEDQVCSIWSKMHALGDILHDLDDADELSEARRGICRDQGLFASGKPIQNCPGISLEEEYSERVLVRKAVLKQREIYWTELEAVERGRDTAWREEIYSKAEWTVDQSYYLEREERTLKMRSRREEMRIEEEKRESIRKTNTATAASRKTTNHACGTFSQAPSSSTFSTTSRANAPGFTPHNNPSGRPSGIFDLASQANAPRSTPHTSPFGVPSGTFNSQPKASSSTPYVSPFGVPSGTFNSTPQGNPTSTAPPAGIFAQAHKRLSLEYQSIGPGTSTRFPKQILPVPISHSPVLSSIPLATLHRKTSLPNRKGSQPVLMWVVASDEYPSPSSAVQLLA
ncbi:DnaJ-domain-containing protein [Acephala macrosclerotiorum]|nr:DnaJ-domain-containing protein [Acephala macrosclerotiorum]